VKFELTELAGAAVDLYIKGKEKHLGDICLRAEAGQTAPRAAVDQRGFSATERMSAE
jgi:hypothetical protein